MIHSTVIRFAGAAAVASLLLAGCGGGSKSETTTRTVTGTTTNLPLSTAGAMTQNATAAVPADVNCGAVSPVWVNLKSKAYHEVGDPYYGKTKNGKYMCPSAATAAGYHAAGGAHGSRAYRKHGKHSGTQNGAMMNATPPPDSEATSSP
ncbi:MAG: hypothetical protein ABI182_08815 [Candidatus Baltobacteraceae bacterium]